MQKSTTFLMFEGKAEEAMNFYTGLFKNSAIVNMILNLLSFKNFVSFRQI